MNGGLWTARDLDIVESLTQRVRLLSLDQVARIWWAKGSGLRVVHRRLRKLAEAGLIECRLVNVCIGIQPTEPLISWSAGDEEPNADKLADRNQSRWDQRAVPTEIITATRLAANLFGSSVFGLPPVHHRDHDLLLSEIYVVYCIRRPTEANLWRGADNSCSDSPVPRADAFLLNEDRTVVRAIESAGHAGAHEITAFHRRCAQASLSYELW